MHGTCHHDDRSGLIHSRMKERKQGWAAGWEMLKSSNAPAGCWQHVRGELSNRLQAQADWCSRVPGLACPSQFPSHASSALWEPETSALRPVRPHSAHGARAQFGISINVRNDRPAPGCPSDPSSALYWPVSASFGAREPTQRARLPSPVRHPHDECSKRSPCAQMPVTRFQCPI